MMYEIDKLPAEIRLGNEGEKGTVGVLFDMAAWEALYPGLTVAETPGISDGLWITYTRCGETDVYPDPASALSLDEDGILTWKPSDAVLDVPGSGTLVVHLIDNGREMRSVMTSTYVLPGHGAQGTPPEPLADYIAKWGAVDATIEMLEAGTEPIVAVTQDETGTHFAFSIPFPSIE